jgi:hypothetical protein
VTSTRPKGLCPFCRQPFDRAQVRALRVQYGDGDDDNEQAPTPTPPRPTSLALPVSSPSARPVSMLPRPRSMQPISTAQACFCPLCRGDDDNTPAVPVAAARHRALEQPLSVPHSDRCECRQCVTLRELFSQDYACEGCETSLAVAASLAEAEHANARRAAESAARSSCSGHGVGCLCGCGSCEHCGARTARGEDARTGCSECDGIRVQIRQVCVCERCQVSRAVLDAAAREQANQNRLSRVWEQDARCSTCVIM